MPSKARSRLCPELPPGSERPFHGLARLTGLLVETEDERDDRELVELINRKGGRITPRQLAHTSTQYRAPGAAEAALENLIKAGHGRWQVDHATGGRPANVFVLSDHDEARNVTEPLESPKND